MVFAEAMAHGIPIIATAAGAIPKTVPREAGLLVRPGDAAALARALRRMIAGPALAAGLAAGSRAAGGRLPDWRQAAERGGQAMDRLAVLPPHCEGNVAEFALLRPALLKTGGGSQIVSIMVLVVTRSAGND